MWEAPPRTARNARHMRDSSTHRLGLPDALADCQMFKPERAIQAIDRCCVGEVPLHTQSGRERPIAAGAAARLRRPATLHPARTGMGNGASLTSATFFFFLTTFLGGIPPVQRRLSERPRCETRRSRGADAPQARHQQVS